MKRFRLAHVSTATFAVMATIAFVYACGDNAPIGPGLESPDGSTPALPPGPDSSYTPDAAQQQDAAPQVDAAPDAAPPCTFPVPIDETVSAEIKVTADDFLKLWVNGVLVADKTTTWNVVGTHTVTLFRNPSRKNVIAVEARNAYNAGGTDRGLLLDLGVDVDAGTDAGAPRIVTDLSWKIVGTMTDGGLPDGGLADGGTNGIVAWFDPTFDDSSWLMPFDQGPHGMSPYGLVFGTSAARWLWSYESSSAGSKPADDFVYFRRTFYLDLAGQPQTTPPSCE